MAPKPRPGAEYDDTPKADARKGAVLILFYPHRDQIYIPMILRPTYSGVHSGQVGLPGGGQEAIDDDLTATALREAHEEVGVDPGQVTILGRLSRLFVSPSNYLVQPTVAWTDFRPEFQIDPYEVAMLIEAPIEALLDPGNLHEEERRLRDRHATVPFYAVEDQVIWGATAMMLSELLSLPALQGLR
jgi:8-oxo-dGTP pyrophosphatase MutT (NUDIX family)